MLICAVIFSTCKPEEQTDISATDTNGASTIELEKVAEFNEIGGYYLSGFRDVLITQNGNLLVNDFNMKSIMYLDEDGNLLQKIGREGRGPGEFSAIDRFLLTPDDSLHVFDRNNARQQVFAYYNGEWGFVREYSRRIEVSEYISSNFPQFVFYADNELWGHFRNDVSLPDTTTMYTGWVSLIDHNLISIGNKKLMRPIQEAVVIRDHNSVITNTHPFGFTEFVQSDSEGILHSIRNDGSELRVFDIRGEIRNTVNMPLEKIPLNINQVNEYLGIMRENYGREVASLSEEKILPHQPTVSDFVMDNEGRYWLETPSAEPTLRNWLAFDSDGTKLGRFEIMYEEEEGTAMFIYAFQKNRIYALQYQEFEPSFVIFEAIFPE